MTGTFSSIDVDSGGYPHLCYFDAWYSELQYLTKAPSDRAPGKPVDAPGPYSTISSPSA